MHPMAHRPPCRARPTHYCAHGLSRTVPRRHAPAHQPPHTHTCTRPVALPPASDAILERVYDSKKEATQRAVRMRVAQPDEPKFNTSGAKSRAGLTACTNIAKMVSAQSIKDLATSLLPEMAKDKAEGTAATTATTTATVTATATAIVPVASNSRTGRASARNSGAVANGVRQPLRAHEPNKGWEAAKSIVEKRLGCVQAYDSIPKSVALIDAVVRTALSVRTADVPRTRPVACPCTAPLPLGRHVELLVD